MPTTIHLIRHGYVYNPDGVMYGRLPNFRLSDEGREQAHAAGKVVAGMNLAAFFASPLQRAQERAAIIAAEHGALDIITEDRIIEIHSAYEGLPIDDIGVKFDLYDGPPPYESPDDVLARSLDFMQDMRQRYVGQEVAAVTHGDVIVFSFLYAQSVVPSEVAKHSLLDHGLPESYPQTASINSFTFHTDDPDERPAYRYHRPY